MLNEIKVISGTEINPGLRWEAEVRIDDVGRLDVVGYRGSYPEIVIDAKTGATPYANQFACYLRWFENATPATSSRVLIALVCRIRRSRRSGSGRRSGQTGLTSSADAANRCTTIRTLRTRQREQHFLEVRSGRGYLDSFHGLDKWISARFYAAAGSDMDWKYTASGDRRSSELCGLLVL